MNTVGIRLNTKTMAVSQYGQLEYNSLAVMSGVVLGLCETGLYTLDADTAVTSYFETKHVDLDSQYAKQLRTVYLTGVFVGSLTITSVIDSIDCETVTIVSESSLTTKTYVKNFSSDHRGRFIGLKIANVNGADFSVDKISIVVSITSGKWEEISLTGRVRQNMSVITIASTGV
jgi:hypothetical protein